MNKIKTLTALFTALIMTLALLLAGCGGEETPPVTYPAGAGDDQPGNTTSISQTTTSPAETQPAEVDVQQLVEESISNKQNITTFKMTMDYSMIMQVTGGNDPGTMAMNMYSEAEIDNKNKEMFMSMSMDMNMDNGDSEQMPFDTKMEMYAVDGWMYTKVSIPMFGDQWMKMKLTEETWAEQVQTEDMWQFLDSAADYEIVGSEVINGVDCYILKVTPSMEKLLEWAASQQETGMEINDMITEEALKSFEVKEWIARDSKMPMREMIKMIIEIGSEDSQGEFEQMTMDIRGTLDYYDFGKPVTITLPPEAASAQEMPGA